MNKLDEIVEYVSLATPGPWKDDVDRAGELHVRMDEYHTAWFGDMEDTDAADHDNAAFIANIRMDAPLLLAVAVAAAEVDKEFYFHALHIALEALEAEKPE